MLATRSMRRTARLLALVGGLALAAAAPPHGGIYRTPPPIGTPGKGQANTGGPSTTGGGVKHTDPAAWSQWWALSRDLYMPRAARVFDGRPPGEETVASGETRVDEGPSETGAGLRAPREVLQGLVAPALLLALQQEGDVDLRTAALMALAKLGETTDDADPPDLMAAIERSLDHDDQEVAEAAVVALGVLGDRRGALHLAELLHGTRAGAALVGERAVPMRTRAYAGYGLAVLGARAEEESVRRYVAHQLVEELERRRPVDRDVSVACVLGLGLLPLAERGLPDEDAEDEEPPGPTVSREGQVLYLLSLLEERRFDDAEKSFVPVAAARLVQGASPALRERVGRRLIELVQPRAKVDDELRAGAIQALGLVGDDGMDALAVAIRGALTTSYQVGSRLPRNLALVALGRCAGRAGPRLQSEVPAAVRAELMQRVIRGQSSEKPWAALAVGILEHGRRQRGGTPDAATCLALRQQFESVGNPSFSGALAIALGLCGDLEAAPLLVPRLTTGDETVRAHAATALGLMRARDAIAPLRALAGGGPPGIAREAAIALALCGDKQAWRHLDGDSSRTSAAGLQEKGLLSLAYVGDGRAVVPLVEVVVDKRATPTRRAYAVVALGIVCDKDPVPWNHPLAQDAVWWSAPPTLLDSANGLGVVDFY